MRQAIQTKYLGPTDMRGGRIKASADAGSITVAWDHKLGIEANHTAAAQALAAKLGWKGQWSGGGLASGCAYVLVDCTDFVIQEDRDQ